MALYTDIDRDHAVNKITGDVKKLADEDAVLQSVESLISTKKYDRFFQPDIYSVLPSLLFEPIDEITQIMIETELHRVITRFEPRVNVESVSAKPKPDENEYEVTVLMTMVPNNREVVLRTALQRVR